MFLYLQFRVEELEETLPRDYGFHDYVSRTLAGSTMT